MTDFFFETDQFMEFQDGLIVGSPSKMQRKSSLGEAIRLKTPIKAKNYSINDDKENGNENRMSNYQPVSAHKLKYQSILTPSKAMNDEILPESEVNDENNRNSLEIQENRAWKVSDFTLGKPLGKGKFGNVYYARQKVSNIPIALKVLFKSQMNNEQILKMLKREIEIQFRLKHENINKLYSYFHDQKNVYLILEYAENGEFYKYLSKNRGLITEDHCKNFISQIGYALDYMHSRHVYHRDIKPENILIGNKDKLLLADFGSAVHAPPPSHSTRYTVCGTPEYLSPEMILSCGHDSSLDMWSLGILMYEILYGRTPFSPSSDDNNNAGNYAADLHALNNDEIQNIQRQKMYERIISYKDNLSFERKRSRSSEGLPPQSSQLDGWREPSEQAKMLLQRLIRANKSDRITAKQFLEDRWLSSSLSSMDL